MTWRPEVAFSVVVPTYNRAYWLRETLHSLLNQSHPPAEIVVVDDGSTDDTHEVLAEYRHRVLSKRIANSGPAAARKAGIELCTSPWIAFCDSDDVWRPNHLERRARLIRALPEAEFTFSNLTECGELGRAGYDKFRGMPAGWWDEFPLASPEGFRMLGSGLFGKFLRANAAIPSTIALKRSLYEQVGGIREKFSRIVGEDADLTRRCVEVGTVACDMAITVEVRKHALSRTAQKKYPLGRIEILEECLRDGSVPERYRSDVIEAIKATWERTLTRAFNDRDFDMFRDVSQQVAFSDLPVELKLRTLLTRLPAPWRNSLIGWFERLP